VQKRRGEESGILERGAHLGNRRPSKSLSGCGSEKDAPVGRGHSFKGKNKNQQFPEKQKRWGGIPPGSNELEAIPLSEPSAEVHL